MRIMSSKTLRRDRVRHFLAEVVAWKLFKIKFAYAEGAPIDLSKAGTK